MIKALYISYNAITEPIVQSQVIPYLRELSKKDIKFYLLTFEKKRMKKEEKNKIQNMLRKEFHGGPDLEWFSLNYHKRPTVPATLFDIIVGCIYSIFIIIKNKIDVIHARAIVAALAGYPAAKMLSKKFIFDTRGIDSEEYVDGDLWKRGGFKHKMVALSENGLIKSADHVIVLTERFLKILSQKYRDRKIEFSVIPCAVDTDRFKPKKAKNSNAALAEKLGIRNKFVIVYTGSLGTWYMFSEMIDFFKIAVRLIKNAHFLILTQSDKTYAANLIKKKGLDMRHVTVTEAPSTAVPDYLAVCDIGIFFIKPVFSKLSSSPVKFAEYLSSGLPVVINACIGDTERMVKRYNLGTIVDEFNDEGYTKALKALMKMIEGERDALKSRCRIVAERELSLKMATEKYYKVYASLLKT